MTPTIIPVLPDDADRVAAMLKTMVADRGLGFSAEARRYYGTIWSAAAIRQHAGDSRRVLLQSRCSGRLAGMLLGSAPEGGVATIFWILVAKTHRRRGIGGSLFREACERYRKMGCHKVKLTAPTRRAVAFYKKLGMTLEGFHPGHWWRMEFWSMGLNL